MRTQLTDPQHKTSFRPRREAAQQPTQGAAKQHPYCCVTRLVLQGRHQPRPEVAVDEQVERGSSSHTKTLPANADFSNALLCPGSRKQLNHTTTIPAIADLQMHLLGVGVRGPGLLAHHSRAYAQQIVS